MLDDRAGHDDQEGLLMTSRGGLPPHCGAGCPHLPVLIKHA